MQVDSGYSTSYLTIVSRSPDRIIVRQKHRSWGDLISEILGTVLVTGIFTISLCGLLIIPLLLTFKYFPSFFKDWIHIFRLIVFGGFCSIVLGIVVRFLLQKPLQTIWTFDSNARSVHFAETSAIGRQHLSTKFYLPRSLKLHFEEENYYNFQVRIGSYWTSKAWAIIRWENDTNKSRSKIKKEDNQIIELRFLLDGGIIPIHKSVATLS